MKSNVTTVGPVFTVSDALKHYILIHTHRNGTDVRAFKSAEMPIVEDAVAALEIDYEPERGEDIDFVEFDPYQLTIVK